MGPEEQHVIRFENDFGVSIVRGPNNYSGSHTWEVAVIHFFGPGEGDWRVVYDTPVTQDTADGLFAWQSPEEIRSIVDDVRALPPRRVTIEG